MWLDLPAGCFLNLIDINEIKDSRNVTDAFLCTVLKLRFNWKCKFLFEVWAVCFHVSLNL